MLNYVIRLTRSQEKARMHMISLDNNYESKSIGFCLVDDLPSGALDIINDKYKNAGWYASYAMVNSVMPIVHVCDEVEA